MITENFLNICLPVFTSISRVTQSINCVINCNILSANYSNHPKIAVCIHVIKQNYDSEGLSTTFSSVIDMDFLIFKTKMRKQTAYLRFSFYAF